MCHIVYFGPISFIYQASHQAFGMINNLGCRLSERNVGIGHDVRVGDLREENIFQPGLLGLRVCPGGDGVAAEAVDSPDTKMRLIVSEAN